MKKIIYFTAILLFSFSGKITSQVSVGNEEQPAAFSTLQVNEDKGGLLLPKLSTLKMADLANSILSSDERNESHGLVIYNTDLNSLAFWDSKQWVYMVATIDADNGVKKVTKTLDNIERQGVELGGDLMRNTEIDQAGFDFKVESNSAARELSIGGLHIGGSNNITIDNSKAHFSAEDIDGASIAANMESKSVSLKGNSIAINTDKLNVSDGKTSFSGQLKYDNSPNDIQRGDLLQSDASGNAIWSSVRPFGSVIAGAIQGGEISFGGSDNGTHSNGTRGKNITAKDLVLPRGQWIIFAGCTTDACARDKNGKKVNIDETNTLMYHWMDLYKVMGVASYEHINRTGVSPQLVGDTPCSPSMSFPVNIASTTTFRLHLATSNVNSYLNGGDKRFGTPYFFAVMIDGFDSTVGID